MNEMNYLSKTLTGNPTNHFSEELFVISLVKNYVCFTTKAQ